MNCQILTPSWYKATDPICVSLDVVTQSALSGDGEGGGGGEKQRTTLLLFFHDTGGKECSPNYDGPRLTA